MFRRIFLNFVFLLYGFCIFSQSKADNKPYLLVVSLDGFRWDYPAKYKLAHFDTIAQRGVKAKSVKPCFPTVTFPNHYSMATGLYPDNHGIVQNKFYDSRLDLTYKIGDSKTVMDGRFYGGEPIWVTAEKQGVKAASFYWVGSEAKINGIQPTYWKQYENKIPFSQRIDTLMYWFQLPENERPHLVMFYLPEPDECSHDFGPDSKETELMLTYLDSLMWVLVNKINSLPIAGNMNIIITSDHGMAQLNNKKNIFIDEFIKSTWVKAAYGYNPTYNISVNTNCLDSVYNSLKKLKHLKVWKTAKLPGRLHYGNNSRVGDLVVLADDGWSISQKKDKLPSGGAHGYDNKMMDMHGIFYAIGPAFKVNYKVPTFENINLYPLMAKLLNIIPAVCDGKLSETEDVLK